VQKTIDFKLILYILGIIVIAVAIWWVVSHKSKSQPQPPPPQAA
jgi:plastocyanin domain-containing protein